MKKHFVAGTILVLVANATRLVTPLFSRSVIDDVITPMVDHESVSADVLEKSMGVLIPLLVAIVALTLTRAVSNYVRGLQYEQLSQKFVYNLRTGLYDHLGEMPYDFYDKHRIGEIMSRMTGDIEGLRNFLAGGLVQILENCIWFFGSMIFLFTLHAPLALIVFAFAPVVAVLGFLFNKRIRPAFSAIREQNAVLNNRTQENIAGVRVVKAFARESYEKEIFGTDNEKQRDLHIKATYIWADFYPLLELISNLTQPVLLLAGGYMVFNGDISLGTLVAFTNYIWMVNGPMRMLGNIINMTAQAVTSTEKLFYYIDLGPSIRDREDASFPSVFAGHVHFDHVTFSYGDGTVLRDVTFDAPPGKITAVMGATGTGKTSLVNLLARFYECSEGSVTIDGMDVKDMRLKQLRDRVGFVSQESFLFSETIAGNIAFGRPDAPMERIIEAAKAAQAHDFITAMPQGYDTVVGERGTGLSGGQRQRVAIARAILYDPTIMVLDDATSAVDMETEYEIQKALEGVMRGRTTFIIAHRISSVKKADNIIVLGEDGRIAESGTHETLMRHGGLYREMYRAQYSDYDAMSALLGLTGEVV